MEHTTPPVPAPAPAGPDIIVDGPSGPPVHPIQGAAPFYQHVPAIQEARDDYGVRQPWTPPAEPAAEGPITRRVELPSGGWAELRDPHSIRAKHRKRALDGLNIDRMQAKTAGITLDMTDGLIIMMVERWSVPYLPGEGGGSPALAPTLIDELTIPDYDALADNLESARKLLFPQPASVDDRRPGSPTQPAAG